MLAAAGAVAGEGFPVLTGRGAELRSVVGLLDGLQYATLLEDPRLLASEAADRVIDALRTGPAGIPDPSAAPPGAAVDNGARQVPASLVQPQAVRADDIDALVIGSGYWTQAQLDDAVAEFGQAPEPTALTRRRRPAVASAQPIWKSAYARSSSRVRASALRSVANFDTAAEIAPDQPVLAAAPCASELTTVSSANEAMAVCWYAG